MMEWRVLPALWVVGCVMAGAPGCSSDFVPKAFQLPGAVALSTDDVQRTIAQGVAEAQARQAPATIAVVDRVGNVLGIFQMNGAPATLKIDGGHSVTGGLDGNDIVPSELGAISKAITAAYLSSAGNAFSTRTAGQIVQEHFNPGEANAPSGALFGVQFSQLTCSDVNKQATDGSIGPKRSPLGFAADPGGLPLYKDGSIVGAVGVIAAGTYSVETNFDVTTLDEDELIAVAATSGLEAPEDLRADMITIDGRTLRFTNSEQLISDPASAPSLASLEGVAGDLDATAGYGGSPIVAGTIYGTPESGVRSDTNPAFGGLEDSVLVDATNQNLFPPMAGVGGLSAADVQQLLLSALEIAGQTRAQIRRPLGSIAQVSAVVVDTNGDILGYVCSPDALLFSTDVAVQKARTALFFSSTSAADELAQLPASTPYLSASRTFFDSPSAFADGVAYSTRAVNQLGQPFFPDGIDSAPPGPFAKPASSWSIFNNGLQLDLVIDKLLASITADDRTPGCTNIAVLRNGITFVPGGLPLYRDGTLIGALGVSGDGTEQDDLIAYLGIDQAGQLLANGLGNAPPQVRADTIEPQGTGTRLLYVSCPPEPFLDGVAANACSAGP